MNGYWRSTATNLVSGQVDTNNALDVFLDDRVAGVFVTVTPCRLFDSRLPADGPALPANVTTVLMLGNRCGIPLTAKALSLNLTAVQPVTDGLLQAFAGDQSAPQTSVLNFRAGKTRADNAIVRESADGAGRLALRPAMSGPSVDVVIDVNGYFE